MKKVRVLREMPFAKKGDIATESTDSNFYLKGSADSYTWIQVERMIDSGWLEYIKEEKRLEDA